MTNAEPRVLLVFHSDEGQTAKVTERIASRVRAAGMEVEVRDAPSAPGPTGFDAVVLGDSIHMQHHSRELRRYATTHAEAINAMPSALFQVSMTSADHDEEHDRLAHKYVADLLHEAGIDPDVVGLFAGAIAYTRYGWIKRRIMQKIAEADGQPTDPTRDVELTDWDEVDHFADDVAKLVAGARPSAAD
ncbi:MAG: flavodoxin domain-containing protein [Acidimicrobiales bacterium]|nr:flavodoxin domain-containing protein [Acidimicrobiales bacterium]